MTFPSETLGVPTTGLPVLLELVHERTGLFFDNGRGDLFAERMAPLVVERGFRSFLDLYYLLKYDESGGNDGWRQVLDALSVPETYFWREIDQIRAVAKCVMPELARTVARPDPDLERAVRERGGAADDRDGARGGRLVRSRADRDPRQRRQPRRDREGARRALPAALDARAAGGAAGKVFRRRGRRVRATAGAEPAHFVLERRESDAACRHRGRSRAARSCSAATRSSTSRRSRSGASSTTSRR